MKKQQIKPLPIVKAYTDYFIQKAERALKLKKADFKRISVDYASRGTVWVWFFGKDEKCVGRIIYGVDGRERFRVGK